MKDFLTILVSSLAIIGFAVASAQLDIDLSKLRSYRSKKLHKFTKKWDGVCFIDLSKIENIEHDYSDYYTLKLDDGREVDVELTDEDKERLAEEEIMVC